MKHTSDKNLKTHTFPFAYENMGVNWSMRLCEFGSYNQKAWLRRYLLQISDGKRYWNCTSNMVEGLIQLWEELLQINSIDDMKVAIELYKFEDH